MPQFTSKAGMLFRINRIAYGITRYRGLEVVTGKPEVVREKHLLISDRLLACD